jgi:hypothetical protein
MAKTSLVGQDMRNNALTLTGPLISSTATTKSYISTAIALTYSASMTPNLASGDIQVITVTNTSAFTINAPTGITTSGKWLLRINNASGGVMGTITWNAVFRQGTVTSPANGKAVILSFYWDGTSHLKTSEADAI